MASPTNEGGVGGKLRKRPFRRAPATPYDRPPTAVRGVRVGGFVGEGGGWISRFVDPASKLIAGGAFKLFSSMFRKRLTAAPAASEEDNHPREEVSQIARDNGDRDGGNKNNSDSVGIAEIEQLLNKKKFNKAQYDRLSQLLLSRTAEPLKLELELNHEKKEKSNISAQEDRSGSLKAHEGVSVPVGSIVLRKQIPKDDAASPEELAKAYMGSRPFHVSDSDRSLRNQVFKEDMNSPTIPSASKPLDLSVAPRSGIRLSGISEHPELDHQSSRRIGRSAMYRMSRSPYFKVNSLANVQQAGELSADSRAYHPSSQWTPRSAMQSSVKQVLKRGSSVLDGDFGTYGPIRRIRQKSNLLSPPKDRSSLFPGSQSSSILTSPFEGATRGSISLERPLQLDGPKYGSIGSQAGEKGNSSASPFPPESSERAHKLFQQLDKLFPSPKEKSSELKAIVRDEPPSKLTLGMLHGSALKSMEDITSSSFVSMQSSSKSDFASASHPLNSEGSEPKLKESTENGSLQPASLGVRLAGEANGVSNAPIVPKDQKIAHVSKRPAFQISAPEDPLDLDDDEDDPAGLCIPSTAGKDDAVLNTVEHKTVIAETSVLEKSVTSSSQSIQFSNSVSFKKAEKKAPVHPVVTDKPSSFAFSVAADSYPQSQPPPTPTMPAPLLKSTNKQNEQASPPYSFASQGASLITFSSATIGANDIAGTKEVGEGSGSELKVSTSVAITSPEGSIVDKGYESQKAGDSSKSFGESQKAGDSSKPCGDTVLSGISKPSGPPIFAFGDSSAPSLSNGSLQSPSATFSVPDSAAATLSGGLMSSALNKSTVTLSISSSSSVTAPVSSAVPSFKFGAATSAAAHASVSAALDKSNSSLLEEKPVESTPFSTHSTSSIFASIRSSSERDVAASFTNFSSGSFSSAIPALAVTSSTGGGSTLSPPSLFSNITGSSSSGAQSAFQSIGSTGFGFSTSMQFSNTSTSVANNSFQNSSVTTFGGSTSSSSLFSNSSSQSLSTTASNVTGGSLFVTPSPQSGTTQISQSTTSQFGSFSSAPVFGLANSSSGSIGASLFGSVTSSVKPFTSSSGFSFSAGSASASASASSAASSVFSFSAGSASASSAADSSSSFAPPATTTSFVGSSSQTSAPSIFAAAGANSSSPFAPSSTAGLFGAGSQAPTSSIFASSSTSNAPPPTGFSFGSSNPGPAGSPFAFGLSSSSSASPFSFTSAATMPSPIPSSPAPAFGFGSSSPGNDQMNVEDSMTDDTNQPASPFASAFGLPPANPQTFAFGSSSVQPSGMFQFGGQQNPSVAPTNSLFQPAGNVDFTAGGSFSLGSGGGEKSGRKFLKVKRDRTRKK